jgi:uncharacterized protein YqeY
MYKEVVDKYILSSMKSGEHVRLSVWRSIKTEFVKFLTSGNNVDLTDDKELQIINKMAQQRRDSIEEYIKAGRKELADAEKNELDILMSLLPNEPNNDDILCAIKDFLASKTEKVSMKDMRDVMSYVKSKYPTVDGGIVTKIFRENFI